MSEENSKNLMGSVDQRTQLAGQNRMELLIFSLGDDDQKFGINVFKVREVILCPKITKVPHAETYVLGMANVRKETIPIIDLAAAVEINNDRKKVSEDNPGLMIVTEYNTRTQGFLVKNVNRIINKSWADIEPPPENLPNGHYLTAITQFEDDIVEILDVERVLAEIDPSMKDTLSEDMVEASKNWTASHGEDDQRKIMIVDDSVVARKQLIKCLEEMGAKIDVFNDGQEAYDHLAKLAEEGHKIESIYRAIVSDIEMPRMDGYAFVSRMKESEKMRDVKVVLHSSLSGGFNESLVKKVGADAFIPKFDPDRLAKAVIAL